MKALKNKIAVVTGGNSGIGYAAAKELKEQGAEVIITGRRKAAVDAAAAELGVAGMLADQGSLPAIEHLAAAVKAQSGKIDILFINAGVLGGADIENATEEVFDSVIGVNFKGAFFTLSRFIPLLNDGASVVFLSSNTASMNVANSSIYSSGKAALNAVMKIAAVELARVVPQSGLDRLRQCADRGDGGDAQRQAGDEDAEAAQAGAQIA